MPHCLFWPGDLELIFPTGRSCPTLCNLKFAVFLALPCMFLFQTAVGRTWGKHSCLLDPDPFPNPLKKVNISQVAPGQIIIEVFSCKICSIAFLTEGSPLQIPACLTSKQTGEEQCQGEGGQTHEEIHLTLLFFI